MVESALDSETQVRGFADRLGERFIVPQPSGSLLEHLNFRRDLAAAPFFEPAVKERLARLANFRHATYTRARRLQKGGERGELVLVSAHVPGRHLIDVLQTASRNGFRPPTAAVLWLTRQLLTSVALLHDYGPDVFHGAIGPERVILPGDGRVILAEYVLGTAIEHAVRPWGVHHLWRELRVATLADFNLSGYGRRVDLLQVGLVTLAFVLGRPLTSGEFPEGLSQAVGEATEAGADGTPTPLRPELRAWIERMVCLDPDRSYRSLLEGQKAFGQLLQEGGPYSASSAALQAFIERCESAPWYQPAPDAEPSRRDAEAPAEADRTGETGTGADVPEGTGPAGGPSSPELVALAALSGEPAPTAETPGGDSGWAPTPEADFRTLFEASPPPPPAPPAVVERLPEPPIAAGLEAFHEQPPVGHPPQPEVGWRAPEASQETAGRGPAGEFGFPEKHQEPPTYQPAARAFQPVAPAVPRPTRAEAGRVTTLRRRPARASWLTPGRIGAVGGLVVVTVLLALAVPRFWGRVSAPVEGKLVVESDPGGAEIIVDGREVGSTPATVTLAPGAHKLEVRIGGSSRSAWVNVPEGGTLNERVELSEAMQRSGLRITTHPPGAEVSIDGAASGKAPLRVSDLQPGTHLLSVQGPFGLVEQEIKVAPGEVASVRVGTAGWVRLTAPFALDVTERGRVYGNTSEGPVMVPAGLHHFDLVNTSLAVKIRQFVEVPPGETVRVPFEAPSGMMNLTADQPAEVWLDGQALGHTPLISVAVPLGTHEVVFRHPKLGEVRYSVLVTLAAPVRLSVTFTKK